MSLVRCRRLLYGARRFQRGLPWHTLYTHVNEINAQRAQEDVGQALYNALGLTARPDCREGRKRDQVTKAAAERLKLVRKSAHCLSFPIDAAISLRSLIEQLSAEDNSTSNKVRLSMSIFKLMLT